MYHLKDFILNTKKEKNIYSSKLASNSITILNWIGSIHLSGDLFNLDEVSIPNANLSGANLCSVSFKHANLENSILIDCDFSKANLDGANLNNVELFNKEIDVGCRVYSIALSYNGEILASGNFDKTIKIWKVSNLDFLR